MILFCILYIAFNVIIIIIQQGNKKICEKSAKNVLMKRYYN
jgi:hypothetical protein